MRLRRLGLTRYGCFTDFLVDFGERDPAQADLHVIYGPNESGKSTLLAAFLDLMFGIEKRSPYAFIHDYRSMRIGASLEIASRTHEVARIKRDNESLLGTGDQPVPETMLSSALGSIDRAGYTTMFSLDDDTLQSGGESILQSEGDLGRLLFSATSGLSRLSRQLDDIKASTDEFYRPRGRVNELKRLKDHAVDLKHRQSEADVNVRQYTELCEKAISARTSYEAAKAEQDQLRVRYERAQQQLDGLPIWADLKALRDKLEPLRAVPDAPVGWAEEAQGLLRNEASKKAEIKGAKEDLGRLTGELDEIVVDQLTLALQERIERIKEDEGRYRTAIDIATLEHECRAVDERIVGLVERLGRSAPDDSAELPLPAATVGALNGLIETRSGLLTRHDTARGELTAANDQVEQAKTAVNTLGVEGDVASLEAILTRVRAQEYGALHRHAQQRHAEMMAEIEADLISLQPWHGDLEVLAMMSPPKQTRIGRWRDSLVEVHEEQATLCRKRAELLEERDRFRAQIATMKESTGLIDDAEAAAGRSVRDEAWGAHRSLVHAGTTDTGLLDEKGLRSTADAFEAAMAEDDRLGDLRVRQSAEIARLRQAEETVARTHASLTHVDEQLETVRTREMALRGEIADALRSIGLPDHMEPMDLERWLEDRDTILKKRMELRNATIELQVTEAAIDEARSELMAALVTAEAAPNENLGLSQLLDLTQGVIGQAKEQVQVLAAAQKTLENSELELRRREREATTAEQAMRAWQDEWSGLLSGCWLSEGGVEQSPAEVREILMLVSELPALFEKRDGLVRRIQAMTEDKARFVETVHALASEAGLVFEEEKVLVVADDLCRRLSDALQQKKLRDAKMVDLERAKSRLREAQRAIGEIDSRRSEMGALFGVDTVGSLLQKLDQAKEKALLTQQIETRESELVQRLRSSSLTEAESALVEVASDEAGIEKLHEKAVELASSLEAAEEQVKHLYHESMTAEAAAEVDGGAQVARLEEQRRIVLLEIRERAEQYLRLRVGAAAAERALQIYRDRHRSSMMARASEAFRTITRGRFSDLATTPGTDGEVLVGIQSTGGSLIASEMSKGTRFQLYLALRIAGYHEFSEHHETLPFIADDIMETFDDDRSQEGFQLLSGIAEKGQVIYLTHHAHMRDIARRVCGKRVQVHELPALPMSANAR